MVLSAWETLKGYNTPYRQLSTKFKFLNTSIRRWCDEKYKIENQEVMEIKSRIAITEDLEGMRALNDS